jgi:hypothetical protein
MNSVGLLEAAEILTWRQVDAGMSVSKMASTGRIAGRVLGVLSDL